MAAQYINRNEIKNVHSELMRRRDKLISLAYDQAIQMDKLDRECIISFFEHWEIPKRPKDIPDLMKTFFTCCFTYAPLRKYLSSISGSIPTPSMLPNCLSIIYSGDDFLTADVRLIKIA